MTARVLVVEDDVTMAEVLKAYLTRAGYQVEWSGNGAEAAQLWQRISPDVVILDIMLPGLSGLELLRRRRRSGDQAFVIVLSARGEEEDRLVGIVAQADIAFEAKEKAVGEVVEQISKSPSGPRVQNGSSP